MPVRQDFLQGCENRRDHRYRGDFSFYIPFTAGLLGISHAGKMKEVLKCLPGKAFCRAVRH